MCIDGDVLELDIEMDLEEVKEGVPLTSSLFSLLFCMKKAKPTLKIPCIDEMSYDLESFGMMYWRAHE